MAQPLTLSVWSDENVKVADVLAAMEGLRKPERLPPFRTTVMTLVMLASRRSNADWAMSAVYELGGRHPARTLLILTDPYGDTGVDAEVRLLGGRADGAELWFEDIELTVRGDVTDHLDSLIEPFTVADLPVVSWFVDGLPAADDAMIRASDVILVDARGFGDTDCFETIASLLEERPVVDLSWVRLAPWRALLAGLFDGRELRPFLSGVRSVQVFGKTGPRHLLGGWLVDRLGLEHDVVELHDALHVSIGIDAVAGGRTARFEVVRAGDERMVTARAHISGGPESSSVVVLPDATPAWGLADALSHLERDPVYEGALRVALALPSA
ncbi:MAG TPA: glucose-6-phosphate dehydrogenase assembly protein OpcA [Acidimicrobiales bacterium]|nr:glucose-6-phosphate dehydrogenase assembly protein OpcA [Acidimicrobiales bacterium]